MQMVGWEMDRMWWQDCLRGVAAGAPDNPVAEESRHIERCPFCGRTFDVRDLGQVLEHPPVQRLLST